jgi:hypothetical protein
MVNQPIAAVVGEWAVTAAGTPLLPLLAQVESRTHRGEELPSRKMQRLVANY